MKIRPLYTAAIVACALALPAAAHADQDGGKMHHRHHMMMKHCGGHGPFEMLDTNHDGFISKAEMLKHFDSIDANHDGKISKKEWWEHMKKMREGMKHGKQCHGKDNAAAADSKDKSSVNPSNDFKYNE